jgi:hypothetical protein
LLKQPDKQERANLLALWERTTFGHDTGKGRFVSVTVQ